MMVRGVLDADNDMAIPNSFSILSEALEGILPVVPVDEKPPCQYPGVARAIGLPTCAADGMSTPVPLNFTLLLSGITSRLSVDLHLDT